MKVAIYARLSREDEEKQFEAYESESIQNQKSMLIYYATQKNWDIYKIYCDEDYSGIDSQRPEFKQLIEDAKNHKFDIVLCKTQSRFTRDMELVEKYLHNKFIEWNIRFVSLVDHVDTNDTFNKKSRQINGLVNEWYLEDLSENIRKTFDSKRKQGLHIGSFVVYGYKRDEKNKNKLVIDKEAAIVVKKIYNLYEDGNGICKIANILNKSFIPTPTKYKQDQGLNFKNAKGNTDYWSESTISKILKNQVYIGNLVQGYNKKISYKSKKSKTVPLQDRIIVENTHDPIITKEQFAKVQNIFKSKSKICKTGDIHIFSNKLICLNCKGKLYKCQNAKGYIYFSCSNSKTSKKICSHHSIGYENLKRIITQKINEKISNYYDFNNIYNYLFDNSYQKLENKEFLIERKGKLEKNISNLFNTIKSLYLNKTNGTITDELFKELITSFSKEKQEKERLLESINLQIRNINQENTESLEMAKKSIIDKFKNIESLSFDIINSFIDFIEIGEKDNKENTQDVIIHWNF